MLFNSLHFVMFLPLAVAAYFAAPGRWRWAVLLGASYYFYASWRVEYVVLLAGSTLVDYVAARGIGAATTLRARRLWLATSLSTNLGVLFFFKYFDFVSESIRSVLAPLGVAAGPAPLGLLLPVGISFYTFQTLAYTIEVYKGRCPAEKHLGIFALYVSFFPQLVAGPIERPQRLLPQLQQVHRFCGRRVVSGLTRVAWGFFLKLVIADRLAIAVNAVYNNPEGQTAGSIILATYLFAFQIYADFAGYTDIAIGTARIMGFELMENFRRPYFATSITDFWRRWHISMTTWFRDYVFAPLGGARKGRARALVNVVVVFLASGLWHGAAWTYVISGALLALYFIIGHVTRDWRNAAWRDVAKAVGGHGGAFVSAARPWVARAVTFNLLALMWIFFRSNTVGDAFAFVATIATGAGGLLTVTPGLSRYQFVIAGAALTVLLMHHLLERRGQIDDMLLEQPRWVRWGAFYVLATVALMFGEFSLQPFLYFQF